jgi:hypothetical protein
LRVALSSKNGTLWSARTPGNALDVGSQPVRSKIGRSTVKEENVDISKVARIKMDS